MLEVSLTLSTTKDPIAYLVLFSVSVARLVDSVANPTREQNRKLLAASRLMVFSQGLVDGIIFAVIEYLFRRSINKNRT